MLRAIAQNRTASRSPGGVEDVKSENNGVDPQTLIRPLRRRHRAPVHHVHRAAGQSLEWSDEGRGALIASSSACSLGPGSLRS